jgi:hypothetical protein
MCSKKYPFINNNEKSEIKNKEKWKCKKCTYINNENNNQCYICCEKLLRDITIKQIKIHENNNYIHYVNKLLEKGDWIINCGECENIKEMGEAFTPLIIKNMEKSKYKCKN